jgi:Transcriptional regulator, AbiEi antitoxin, Type IV TA system
MEPLLLDAIRQQRPHLEHNDMKTKNAPVKAVATDETIEQTLWDCLAEAPFIETQKVEQRVIADPTRPEIVARVQIGGQERLLLAEVKTNGQPRLVREAVESLTKYRQTYADSYGLVIAPSFTPQAIKICRQEGVGYLDFSGNCLLNFDFVFINKTGRAATGTKRKKFRSWYSPRIERVLRSIFMHPQRVWKIRELALEAHVTAGQAFSIKRHLGERGWLEEFKHGFALARPDLLLDEWSENYLPARNVERVFSSRRTVIEIEAMLASICQEQIIPYALNGFSAAMRFDPLFHYDRVSAYVLSDLSKVISALELTESAGKGNVSLWIPYDEGVLRGAEQFDHAKITSPIQTYLDLIGLEGRGEKGAGYIWQHFMRDKWLPQAAAA